MIETFDCKKLQWSLHYIKHSQAYRNGIEEAIETNHNLLSYIAAIGYRNLTDDALFVLDSFRKHSSIPRIENQTLDTAITLFINSSLSRNTFLEQELFNLRNKHSLFFETVDVLDRSFSNNYYGKPYLLTYILNLQEETNEQYNQMING